MIHHDGAFQRWSCQFAPRSSPERRPATPRCTNLATATRLKHTTHCATRNKPTPKRNYRLCSTTTDTQRPTYFATQNNPTPKRNYRMCSITTDTCVCMCVYTCVCMHACLVHVFPHQKRTCARRAEITPQHPGNYSADPPRNSNAKMICANRNKHITPRKRRNHSTRC